ncbi:MAG: amidohydrolase [Bacteroidota bacterium]
MNQLTVSLVQSDLVWENVSENLNALESKMQTSSETDLIVLPEMFTTGFSMNAMALAKANDGRTLEWMQRIANEKEASICGSFIVQEGEHFFNRCFFVQPDGHYKTYDKRHLFALGGEAEVFLAGKERLVVDLKGWKIMPLICYDLRFPVWSRVQSDDDAFEFDLLIYMANWPKPRIHAWDILLQARAIENQSYCVGVNRIGIEPEGMSYSGNSAAYDYLGDKLCFSQSEEIISATLSLKDLDLFRKKLPFQKEADSFEIR